MGLKTVASLKEMDGCELDQESRYRHRGVRGDEQEVGYPATVVLPVDVQDGHYDRVREDEAGARAMARAPAGG